MSRKARGTMNSMETTCEYLVHLYSKNSLHLTTALSNTKNMFLKEKNPIYLFIPLGLFVGMVWHTANTLPDIESGVGPLLVDILTRRSLAIMMIYRSPRLIYYHMWLGLVRS